jgi:hypothetical protein
MKVEKLGNILVIDSRITVFDKKVDYGSREIEQVDVTLQHNGVVKLQSDIEDVLNEIMQFLQRYTSIEPELNIDEICIKLGENGESEPVETKKRRTVEKTPDIQEILNSKGEPTGYYIKDERVFAVWFDKAIWSKTGKSSASKKAREMGFKTGGKKFEEVAEKKGKTKRTIAYIYKQRDIKSFVQKSEKRIKLGQGIELIVGKPK